MVKSLFILLLTATLAFGQAFTKQDYAFMGAALPAAAGAGTNAVVKEDLMGTTYTTTGLLAGQTNYCAGKWTATSSYILTRLDFRALKVSTDARVYTFAIQPDSDGEPSGVELDSATIAHADLVTGTNTVKGFSCSITNGETYWFVITPDLGTSGTVYFAWRARDATTVAGGGLVSADAETWYAQVARQMSMLIYGY
jgi:hypothetical protein